MVNILRIIIVSIITIAIIATIIWFILDYIEVHETLDGMSKCSCDVSDPDPNQKLVSELALQNKRDIIELYDMRSFNQNITPGQVDVTVTSSTIKDDYNSIEEDEPESEQPITTVSAEVQQKIDDIVKGDSLGTIHYGNLSNK